MELARIKKELENRKSSNMPHYTDEQWEEHTTHSGTKQPPGVLVSICIEEMAELAQILGKYTRYHELPTRQAQEDIMLRIHEEMGDVLITIASLCKSMDPSATGIRYPQIRKEAEAQNKAVPTKGVHDTLMDCVGRLGTVIGIMSPYMDDGIVDRMVSPMHTHLRDVCASVFALMDSLRYAGFLDIETMTYIADMKFEHYWKYLKENYGNGDDKTNDYENYLNDRFESDREG